MSHVILCTVGPVQDFIACARRSRDLWFGSYLLGELSRAVARSLTNQGWRLIFPALDRDAPELLPVEKMWRDEDRLVPPLSIVNRILAVGGKDPAAAATEARGAAIKSWQYLATRARQRAGKLIRTDADLAGAIEDLLEFAVSWAPYDPQRPGSYSDARREVDSALGSRKQLRDFAQWPGKEGRPKSSLDGLRETVLVEDAAQRAPREARRFRLGEREQLDEIGVLKRMGAQPDQFVPLSLVAFAPWIEAVHERTQRHEPTHHSWDRLLRACEQRKLRAIQRKATSWIDKLEFFYEPDIFLQDQWRNLSLDDGDTDPGVEGQRFGHDHVAPLLKIVGAPDPYLACLVADGDRMGEALDLLHDEERHRRFSSDLGGFARGARGIVEDHLGCLIYAGGDDVLAFVPVVKAVPCAAALAQAFAEAMAAHGQPQAPPTLSVGIGIGHVLNPMGQLLRLARQAEQIAKGDDFPEDERRNALAVIVRKRGGGEARCREQWPKAGSVLHLEKLALAMKERRFPRGLPYEIDDILRRFPQPKKIHEAEQTTWARVLRADLQRSILRKPEGADSGVGFTPEQLGLSLDETLDYATLREETARWIERSKVARQMAQSFAMVRRVARGDA